MTDQQPHDDPTLPPPLREALRIMARRGQVVELTALGSAATSASAEHDRYLQVAASLGVERDAADVTFNEIRDSPMWAHRPQQDLYAEARRRLCEG